MKKELIERDIKWVQMLKLVGTDFKEIIMKIFII